MSSLNSVSEQDWVCRHTWLVSPPPWTWNLDSRLEMLPVCCQWPTVATFFQQVQVIPVLSFYLQIRSTQTSATGFLLNFHIFLQLIFLNFCPYCFAFFFFFSSVFCLHLAPGPFKNTFHSSTFQLPVLLHFSSLFCTFLPSSCCRSFLTYISGLLKLQQIIFC